MLTVAIVGKPNVGKSSLFNRIIKKNKSIIDDLPGVTRDRIYGTAEWLTRKFYLIDTGGLTVKEFDFKKQIEAQVNFAIEEAQIIIFLVSSKDQITNDDKYVAKLLKKHKNKKIIFVSNKSENDQKNENEFYSLGFGKPLFISAAHGIGIGDLLDQIITLDVEEINESDSYKFCIIGRPNVGKSSLVNAILQKERVIVSNIAGTTRDAIDTDFKWNQKKYTIIDTAGIKRKGKIGVGVDKYAYIRVEQSIQRSNLIVVVLDGSEEFNEQDEIIAGLAHKANIPCIICVNKWDKVNKNEFTMNEYIKKVRNKFQFISWAPIIFLSALENKRINTLFKTIDEIQLTVQKKISSNALTETIMRAQMMNNSPNFNMGRIKINYVVQVDGQIPIFVLFCNNPNYLHFSYSRYLENEIRTTFGFENVPITLYFKSKTDNLRRKSSNE